MLKVILGLGLACSITRQQVWLHLSEKKYIYSFINLLTHAYLLLSLLSSNIFSQSITTIHKRRKKKEKKAAMKKMNFRLKLNKDN